MPIFDQGYQHWSGHVSGHAWRWLAIAQHGVRMALKGRYMRYMLLVAWLPAFALAATLCVWGLLERQSDVIKPFLGYLTFLNPQILADPRGYRVEVWTVCYDYFLLTELRFSMILILMVGPNLISQDLRFNAFPLYFSRPLRRIDYFLGKLGVIGAFLGMVVVVPSLIAYVLGLLFSLDVTILKDTFGLLLSSLAYGLVVTLSAGTLILALSSLSRNARYIALLWLGMWFVTSVVAEILTDVDRAQRQHAAYSKLATIQAQRIGQGQPGFGGGSDLQFWTDFMNAESEAAKTNWRPLISYTSDLSRIRTELLGTQVRWEKLAQVLPQPQRTQFLERIAPPQPPWHWSAGVLLGLFGLSACILNLRVKSLDRLK